MKTLLQKWIILLILLIVFKYYPVLTENLYSLLIYPVIRTIDLFVVRWIPFSIGDLLYLGFLLWFVTRIIIFLIHHEWKALGLFAGDLFWKIVFVFYLSWGLNYFRVPFHERIDVDPIKPSHEDFYLFSIRMKDSLNELNRKLHTSNQKYELKILAQEAKSIIENQHTSFAYLKQRYYVVKPSVFAPVLSYLQIQGYFNPFTHEAQVNTLYPKVFQPHVVLHELAHQIGYAHETEAEFIAFVLADNSSDTKFKYASYLTAMEYLLQNLKRNSNYTLYKYIWADLDKKIKKDLIEAREFRKKHRLPVNPTKPYDVFLKINQKGKGMESYEDVLLLIMNYMNKNN